MIDTVVLTLDLHQFQISKPDLFQPSARALIDTNGRPIPYSNVQCKQNTKRKDRRNKPYSPRLTLSRRHHGSSFEPMLKIEFSAPKLLFGNNFEELVEEDFTAVVMELQEKLSVMGVVVSTDVLQHARISGIHYSKNIIFTNGATATYYISKLQRLNITRRLDVARTRFRNEGHGFSIHANRFEIVFYDKILDLAQSKISEKRSFEKDNDGQMRIINTMDSKAPFEALRMEVRLGTRDKMRHVLSKIKEESELVFSCMFKRQFSLKILHYFFKSICEGENPLADYQPEEVRNLLAALAMEEPNMTFGKVLQLCGWHHLLGDVTFRELKAMFKRVNKHTFARYERMVRRVKISPRRVGSFSNIEKVILKMEPVDFAKLPEIQQAILKLKVMKGTEII